MSTAPQQPAGGTQPFWKTPEFWAAIITSIATAAVAIVGLLSQTTVADQTAALADRNAQRLFDAERTAEIQDRRHDRYVRYLAAVAAQYRADAPPSEATGPLPTVLALEDADASARLVATNLVKTAMDELTHAAIEGTNRDTGLELEDGEFEALREDFLERAATEQEAEDRRARR